MADEICPYCEEPIVPGDIVSDIIMNGTPSNLHQECVFRMGSGSAAHIRKQCSCYGGTDRDVESGMTRREAAKAALFAWRELNPSSTRN